MAKKNSSLMITPGGGGIETCSCMSTLKKKGCVSLVINLFLSRYVLIVKSCFQNGFWEMGKCRDSYFVVFIR